MKKRHKRTGKSTKSAALRELETRYRELFKSTQDGIEKAILETVEEEQRRIGQDLHDSLCQQLTGIALLAKALAHKLSPDAPNESADASEIAGLISRSIDETRDLARGLSPVEIETDGLLAALQKFASTTERFYKISCVFNYDENAGFQHQYNPLLATHLYRIVQEAVNNAIQHGKAKQVVITLAIVENGGSLTVQDNGIGFQPGATQKPGLGLRSMHYRGRMIGARFKIYQDPGGGTVVICSFPNAHKAKR